MLSQTSEALNQRKQFDFVISPFIGMLTVTRLPTYATTVEHQA